jgi:hypothetical protein
MRMFCIALEIASQVEFDLDCPDDLMGGCAPKRKTRVTSLCDARSGHCLIRKYHFSEVQNLVSSALGESYPSEANA